ncbi:MAG TPA: YkgJ family cysteine cluster protein [Verrucomicrobiae bacterium]|nr:YkgJ family cysteine cluster protein [Verrucomicrobiae bacterium]
MTLGLPVLFNSKMRDALRYSRLGTVRCACQIVNVPIFYECQRCTACCRWPGQVRVSDAEIARLAEFTGMGEFEFIQRYLQLRADRQGLALQNKLNGECIFLEGDNCAVQAVKPQQCSDFPNLWNFPGFEKVCDAIPRRVSEEEYAALIAKATGRRHL